MQTVPGYRLIAAITKAVEGYEEKTSVLPFFSRQQHALPVCIRHTESFALFAGQAFRAVGLQLPPRPTQVQKQGMKLAAWCMTIKSHAPTRSEKELPFAGQRFGADGDQATATALTAIKDAEAEEARQRLAEKAAKKAAFNAEYDVGAYHLLHL